MFAAWCRRSEECPADTRQASEKSWSVRVGRTMRICGISPRISAAVLCGKADSQISLCRLVDSGGDSRHISPPPRRSLGIAKVRRTAAIGRKRRNVERSPWAQPLPRPRRLESVGRGSSVTSKDTAVKPAEPSRRDILYIATGAAAAGAVGRRGVAADCADESGRVHSRVWPRPKSIFRRFQKARLSP